jgi:VWFA-related protein
MLSRYLALTLLAPLLQDESGAKFRLNVNQVVVPVVVTDAKGHRISGLRVEDFELQEDGQPQKIASFSVGGTGPSAEPPAKDAASGVSSAVAPTGMAPASVSAEQIGRTYAICVDTLHSRFANFPPVREALEKFFEKENRTDSQYWLINLGKKPEVLQNPTSNPRDVLNVLRDKKFLATIQNSEASALASQIDGVRRQLDDYCGRCPCGRSVRPAPMECVGPRQSIFGLVTTSADRTRIYTEFFLKELRAVVTDLSHMPGNRVLILVSDGFNLVPGREMYGVMRAYFPNDERWQMNDRDTTSQLEPILREAAANNIVVYGIGSSGLGSTAGVGGGFEASTKGTSARGVGQVILPELNRQAAQASFESGAALEALAHATGGAYIENTNDLLGGIRRAFNETRDYYVLAYASTNATPDGKYRAIEVRVKDSKAVVRARAGYWAQAAPPAP